MGNGNEEKLENNEAGEMLVHPDFRLWLTTQPEVGLPLPAAVIHHGLKLACEAQENFRDAVRTNCRVVAGSLNNCIPLWGEAAKNSVFKVKVSLNRASLGPVFNDCSVLKLEFMLCFRVTFSRTRFMRWRFYIQSCSKDENSDRVPSAAHISGTFNYFSVSMCNSLSLLDGSVEDM